jgi:hypothetical protein
MEEIPISFGRFSDGFTDSWWHVILILRQYSLFHANCNPAPVGWDESVNCWRDVSWNLCGVAIAEKGFLVSNKKEDSIARALALAFIHHLKLDALKIYHNGACWVGQWLNLLVLGY